jgi:polysaccharide export outer membrane protein
MHACDGDGGVGLKFAGQSELEGRDRMPVAAGEGLTTERSPNDRGQQNEMQMRNHPEGLAPSRSHRAERFNMARLPAGRAWIGGLAAALAVLWAAAVPAFADQNATDIRSYKLAPGDRIVVTVFGQADLSGQFPVDGTGSVLLPLVGTVEVMNLTAVQAQERITALLQDGILQRPVVNVGIAEVRPVSVMGDVRNPGVYPFRFGNIVKGVIAQAGGFGLLEQFPGSAMTELLAAEERVKTLTEERRLLLIRQARIEAQISGAKSFKAPLSDEETSDPEIKKLIKQEQEVFESDSAGFEKQLDMIRSQKPQFKSEGEAIDGQVASGEKQLEIVRKQMSDYNQLVNKGLGRTNDMVEIQMGEANILTNNYRLKADQFRVRNQIVMLDIQLVDYENTYKRRLQADLQVLQQRLREIDVALPTAKQTRELRAQLSGKTNEGTVRVISITRVLDNKVSTFEVADTTYLEPGDIVEVKNIPVTVTKPATASIPAPPELASSATASAAAMSVP